MTYSLFTVVSDEVRRRGHGEGRVAVPALGQVVRGRLSGSAAQQSRPGRPSPTDRPAWRFVYHRPAVELRGPADERPAAALAQLIHRCPAGAGPQDRTCPLGRVLGSRPGEHCVTALSHGRVWAHALRRSLMTRAQGAAVTAAREDECSGRRRAVRSARPGRPAVSRRPVGVAGRPSPRTTRSVPRCTTRSWGRPPTPPARTRRRPWR